MLIQRQSNRWKRDSGIEELIKYFNEPKRRDHPENLTNKEIGVLSEELRRCQEHFEYAARNYFWITTKKGEDQLFRLWPSQELILDKIYEMQRRFQGKNKAVKLQIIKARQLGASTLIEGLMAWKSMFFANMNCVVVSHVPKHAAYLFRIMLHIYDRLPWWLRPMVASRREEDIMMFQNPIIEERESNPGLNSQVVVQSANQVAGVGEGYRINGAHISEYAAFDEERAREIIAGDLVHALVEDWRTIAVLESTPKGAGTYAEDLWIANQELGEQAEWYPLFLPWFFEITRFEAPDEGWQPHPHEEKMRERVISDWVRCDQCDEFAERVIAHEDLNGNTCPHCGKGTYRPYVLGDDQLFWIWGRRINAEHQGPESVKELKQELSSNAEEGFQLSGIQVFPEDVRDIVAFDIKDPFVVGNLDEKGRFHGAIKRPDGSWHCHQEWCKLDHRYDPEMPLKIWEWPEPGCEYVCGVDVGEGLGGKADYSVAWINRIGGPHNADVHVATYRSNTISAADFAAPVNFLGRMYNEALMSIEYNIFQTTADLVRIYFQYPNLFRWKHLDSHNVMSSKWHWLTQQNSRPHLWQNAVRRIRARLWVIRDRIFHHEMKRFQKDEYESKRAQAEEGFHDDCCFAAMIASYTSHDMDWDDSVQTMVMESNTAMLPNYDWTMTCVACKYQWGAKNPEEEGRCPHCGSFMVNGKPNYDLKPVAKIDWNKEFEVDENEEPAADGAMQTVADAAVREDSSYHRGSVG